GGLLGFFGDLYFAISLANGKFLTRDQSIRFVRGLAAIYQLLPNAAFCSQHRNWVVFDPLATGHKPVGHMVIFPTLLEGVVEAVAGIADAVEGAAAEAGAKIKEDVDDFLKPGHEERTSPLATANVTTLQEIIETAAKALGDMTNAAGQLMGAG